MPRAVVISAVRTPIGRYGGALSGVRPDDLAALAVSAAVERAGIDPAEIEDVYLGCANQAGEDNRNVARMAALLAGLPQTVPGVTVNRLCASGLTAIVEAARAISAGEGELFVAGGVESMSRAPLSLPKAEQAVGARKPRRVGHRARLALPEPAHGGDVPARVDGRDRRERRRALGDLARGPGHVRAPLAAALGGGAGGRAIRRRARPGRRGRGRRASAADDHAGEAGAAAAGVPRGRHGHRGQCERAQRRRRRARARERGEGARARRPPARGLRDERRGRRRPARDGDRPDRRRPQGARAGRDLGRRPRPRGAERGVRVPEPRRRAASSASTRRR